MIVKLTYKDKEILESLIKYYCYDQEYKLNLVNDKHYQIETSEKNLSDLRELCSDYLIEVGFDEDYKANEDGWILENLIDKFYVR